MEIVTCFGKIDQETGSIFGNKTEVKKENVHCTINEPVNPFQTVLT